MTDQLAKPPATKPEWMSEDDYWRLWEAYHVADDAVASAQVARDVYRDLQLKADKASNHYNGMLFTMTQHTIEGT